MQGIAAGLLTLLLLGTGPGAAAGDPEAEIDHLLRLVGEAPCRFERNGTLYGGVEAAEHLTRKFEYDRGKIKTAEAFIAGVATASSLSGRRYRVHCPGQAAVDSADWLREALRRLRR